MPLHVQRSAVVAKPSHPKGPCRSGDCRRPFCAGYRLGYDEGYDEGYESGHAAGAASAETR